MMESNNQSRTQRPRANYAQAQIPVMNVLNPVAQTAVRAVTSRSGKALLLGLSFDRSGSMTLPFTSDGVSRWKMLVELSMEMLNRLKAMELSMTVLLYVSIFGDDKNQWLLQNVALDEVDLVELREYLLKCKPYGGTPLGEASVEMMNRLQADKVTLSNASQEVIAQPLVAIFSDGEPTSSMDEAEKLCDRLLSERKMVLMPVAIGNENQSISDFPVLSRMLKEETDAEFRNPLFASSLRDLRRHIRFLGRTVISMRSREAITAQIDAVYGAAAQAGQTRMVNGDIA